MNIKERLEIIFEEEDINIDEGTCGREILDSLSEESDKEALQEFMKDFCDHGRLCNNCSLYRLMEYVVNISK